MCQLVDVLSVANFALRCRSSRRSSLTRISLVFKSSIVAGEREKQTVRYIAMHTHRNYNDVTPDYARKRLVSQAKNK